MMRTVTALIVIALFGLLAATLWWAYGLWNALDPEPMPGWMYAAMAGGVLVSLLVGCGLMALMFYSARHGYDE